MPSPENPIYNPQKPYEEFGLTEKEFLFNRVTRKRFSELLNDKPLFTQFKNHRIIMENSCLSPLAALDFRKEFALPFSDWAITNTENVGFQTNGFGISPPLPRRI
jgi:hypothetical protein